MFDFLLKSVGAVVLFIVFWKVIFGGEITVKLHTPFYRSDRGTDKTDGR